MKSLFILTVMAAFIPTITFAECTSGQFKSDDGSIITITIPQMNSNPEDGKGVWASPTTVDVVLSADKCSAASVYATLVGDYYRAPERALPAFLLVHDHDPNQKCHYSGVTYNELTLGSGEGVQQSVAIEVNYNPPKKPDVEWLGVPGNPGMHNIGYRFSASSSTPSQNCFY